jgi:hypothetical protein
MSHKQKLKDLHKKLKKWKEDRQMEDEELDCIINEAETQDDTEDDGEDDPGSNPPGGPGTPP